MCVCGLSYPECNAHAPNCGLTASTIFFYIISKVARFAKKTKFIEHMGEERKLRVFENMVLSKIFGPRRDEVTGDWR